MIFNVSSINNLVRFRAVHKIFGLSNQFYVQLSSLNCAKHDSKIMTRRLSLDKIELFVSELDSNLNSEETQYHNEIAYLVDVMQELTNKYFPNRHLTKKQLKLSQKPWITQY